MSFEDLKEAGNKHFFNSEYDEAIVCYSEALNLQPRSHVLFSNRSVAYSKLKLYQKALDDSTQCIKLAPEFARGYLRKASACNGLEKYGEAISAAEKGYKLRASERICKDCVSEWLIASSLLLKAAIEEMDEIPPGTLPVTKKCQELLARLQQQHDSPGGVSVELLQAYLTEIAKELGRILEKFGHSLSIHMDEWVTAFIQSLTLDPCTHTVPTGVTETQEDKLKELMRWLDMDVDHTLYPVIRPVFSLMTVAMLTCASTLCQLISFRSHIQLLTKTCQKFYKDSILSTDEYIRLHIHALQLQLGSFCMESGHAKGRGEKEAEEIKVVSQELKDLLNHYSPLSSDYEEVKQSSETVISNAAILLSSDQPSEPCKRLTKEDATMLKCEVTKNIESLKAKLNREKSLHFRDMDSLVLSTGGLVYVGEIECAKLAVKESKSFYATVITSLLDNKLLSIDDAAECFFHPQTMMLCNASFLVGIDDSLVADTFIQWKCLATELYALLARLGLSKSLMKTFNKIQAFEVAGKDIKDKEEMLCTVQGEYQKESSEILQEWGAKSIHTLLDQTWNSVQSSLEPDQILLQYCLSPLYDTNFYPVPIPPKVLSLKGVLIVIRSVGVPIVKTLEFGSIQDLALKCHNSLMKAVAAKQSGRAWQELQRKADEIANDLLREMIPFDIQVLINDAAIKRLYFCPDQVLSKFPFEILPLGTGQRLGEKVAITYLSSARELIREQAISCLQPVQKSSFSNQMKKTADCEIFANPNFDLEKEPVHNNDNQWPWSSLNTLLSSFFSESPVVNKASALPGSEKEAYEIEKLLISHTHSTPVNVSVAISNDATLYKVLQVQSPLLLHLATHGFSSPDFHYQYHNFWSDTKSGLLLAGANTYHSRKFRSIASGAGTGELTALAVCGMNLIDTRLVYLSTCRSTYGFIGRGEALSSLAQSFRIAGSNTVIATLWPVSDEVGQKMALHFYDYASKRGLHASLALQAAKRKLQEDDDFNYWYNWAGFLCIGIDTILFS